MASNRNLRRSTRIKTHVKYVEDSDEETPKDTGKIIFIQIIKLEFGDTFYNLSDTL